mgnify:CR=1 FL=1
MYNKKEYFEGVEFLKKKDTVIKCIFDVNGIIDFKPNPNLFECLAKIIISQQLSNKAANTITSRVLKLIIKFEPENFLKEKKEDILRCGVSNSKFKFIEGISNSITKKELQLENLRNLEDDEIMTELLKINGIGEWSASVFMIFGLGKLNVFPKKDVGLKNAILKFYSLKEIDLDKEIGKILTLWEGYKTIPCLHLWSAYDKKIVLN